MSHQPMPVRAYLLVFGALMVLTAVTTAIAYLDLGPLNTMVALTIAVAKALLVVLYFMHLRHSPRLIWLFASASALWLLLLFVLILTDYRTRAFLPGWDA